MKAISKKTLLCSLVIGVLGAASILAEGQGEPEQKVLEVWTWQHEPMINILNEQVIPSFEAKYPNVKVLYEQPGRTNGRVEDWRADGRVRWKIQPLSRWSAVRLP